MTPTRTLFRNVVFPGLAGVAGLLLTVLLLMGLAWLMGTAHDDARALITGWLWLVGIILAIGGANWLIKWLDWPYGQGKPPPHPPIGPTWDAAVRMGQQLKREREQREAQERARQSPPAW